MSAARVPKIGSCLTAAEPSAQARIIGASSSTTRARNPLSPKAQLLIFFAEGELTDLVDEFSEGRIQFAFVKVKDPNSSLPKNVLIAWVSWAPRLRETHY